ncbi:MAG TPA: prolipoprotein diacylglyceryl transferase [Longimicrobiales bacterium]
MFPTLIDIGGFRITTFGLMLVLSILTGAWVLSKQLERREIDGAVAWDVATWVAIAGVLGAKLYFLALHWRAVVADPLGELLSRGGLVWYGGLLGGVLTFYWQVRRRNLPLGKMFDATAPALMLAYAVGRIGCFLVGDDYGLPTNGWMGIAFPEGAPPSTAGYLRSVGADIPLSVPDATVLAVHPTQLYEVAAALVLFAILWKVSSRAWRPGRLFGLYLALYGVERFLIEFVRAKGDRFVFGLSTSQVASLILFVIAAYLWRPAGAPAGATAMSGREAAAPARSQASK